MELNNTKVKIEQNMESDCSPLSSLYCNLKIRLTGTLNQKNLQEIYNCNLCNKCGLASFNQDVREKAVSKNLIMQHVAEIRKNIVEYGNSYGVTGQTSLNKNNTLQSKYSSKTSPSKTILFKGCTPTYKAPEILESVENLLKSRNINYGFIDEETCCGNILFNLGDKKTGQSIVSENIAKFKEAGVEHIITLCPGCYNAFHKYYKGKEGFDVEITLAIDLLDGYVIDHAGCILQNPCHSKEKTSQVIKMFTHSEDISVSPCCGAGAGVLAHNKAMADSKANQLIKSNLEKIVTYCPFCFLNLSSYSQRVQDIYMLIDAQSK